MYPEEEVEEENIVEDDAELTLQQAERDMQEDLMVDDDYDEDDENMLGLEDLKKMGSNKDQVFWIYEVSIHDKTFCPNMNFTKKNISAPHQLDNLLLWVLFGWI